MNRQLQLYQKQKEMYASLTSKQLEIVDEYFSGNMKKLKKICNPLFFQKCIPEVYYEDLYSIASDTLIESLYRFDANKNCSFKTFLVGNIKRSFYDWTRDNMRGKRCNLARDSNGRIKRDEDETPIIISDLSLDASSNDGIDLAEKIDSGVQIEECVSNAIGFSSEDKWGKYLNCLSNKQRKIAVYLSEGYRPFEIREILHITEKEYSEHMSIIKAYENISIIF